MGDSRIVYQVACNWEVVQFAIHWLTFSNHSPETENSFNQQWLLSYFSNCLNSCNLVISFLVIKLRGSWLLRQQEKKQTICQLSDLIINQSFPKYPSVKTCTLKKPAYGFAMQI